MKRFESGDVFKPAYQGQGFEPLQVADTTPLLRQNNQARLQEAKAFADARMTDLKLEEQSLKYQALLEDEQVERLADFSQTLSDTLIQGAKLRNEQTEQYYMMQAYTDMLSPEEAATFDEQEQTLQDGAKLVYDEAGKLESGGLSVDVVNKVRSLSGWAKYGYMRGLVEQGGANYSTYFTNASDTMEVTVGNRTFTLNDARNGAERAAAKAAIADSYLSQYRGVAPGLLNKYLFPEMKKWEQQDDLEFAERQRKAFEADKMAELKDNLYSAVRSDDPGQAVLNLIDVHKGTFGTRGQAIDKTLNQLHKMARDGTLTREQWKQIKLKETTRLDSGEKEQFGVLFEARIGRMEFEEAFKKAEADNREFFLADRQEKVFQLQRKYEKIAANELEDGGVPQEFLEEAQKEYNDITGTTIPWKWLNDNFKSDATVDLEAEVALAKQRMNSKGATPYLTELEYNSLSNAAKAQLRREYGGKLPVADAASGLVLTSDQDKKLEERLKGFTKVALKAEGVDGQHNYTELGFNHSDVLRNYFQEKYDLLLQQRGNQVEAFNEALKLTRDYALDPDNRQEIKDQIIANNASAPATVEHKRNEAIINEWKAGGKQDLLLTKIDHLGNSELYISGGISPMAELEEWRANGGKGPLPSAFIALASQQRGVSAWDVAAAQYALHNPPEPGEEPKQLTIPLVERNVRKLKPESRALLISHHSPSRTARAALQEGGFNQFADLVGYHESSAYGGYDAMNTGGSGFGRNNVAYGSANSKDVFGRGVSEMTVGEVIALGRQQKIFAAGRYQFIPSTLRMVVAREGIDLNAKFDKNTQDFLFASQVRWRLDYHSKHGGMLDGFRTEWQGLVYASRQQIMDGLEAFQGSPFNDPAYLHPGLLKEAN